MGATGMGGGIDLWATPAALEVLRVSGVEAVTLIDRYVPGDFDEVVPMGPGSLDENPEVPHSDGLAMNALAVIGGEDRIMSIYRLTGGVVWIETVWDRSYTTLYLPEEY